MNIWLNTHSLVKDSKLSWVIGQRKTCQIVDLCRDCDVRKFLSKQMHKESTELWMPRVLNCGMLLKDRNFIELEGTPAPIDLLSNPEWHSTVFISSIRHPIDRIVSSLTNAENLFQCIKERKNIVNQEVPLDNAPKLLFHLQKLLMHYASKVYSIVIGIIMYKCFLDWMNIKGHILQQEKV